MKKIFGLVAGILFCGCVLSGCTDTTSSIAVSKSLNDNLSTLNKVVTKLDSVENNYIANPDMYPVHKNISGSITVVAVPPRQNAGISTDSNFVERSLAHNDLLDEDYIDTMDDADFESFDVEPLASNSVTINENTGCTKKTDKQGNCLTTYPDGSCQISDPNGNPSSYQCNGETYGINCKKSANNCTTFQVCDNNGNCLNYVCDKNGKCVSSTCNEGCSASEKKALEKVVKQSLFKDYKKTLINSLYGQLIDNLTKNDTNSLRKDVLTGLLENINQETEITPEPEAPADNTRNKSFALKSLTYNPRYLSSLDETEADSRINNYILKVQKMYAMSSDVIEANNTLNNCKINLLTCINEVKEINNSIMNGSVEPNNAQLEALNNYIYDMKNTIHRIKQCNGQLNNEIKLMNSTSNPFASSGLDVSNSNYLRILNHLDARITYLKSAIATLEQVKYLLLEIQTMTDEEIDQAEETPSIDELVQDNADEFDDTQLADTNQIIEDIKPNLEDEEEEELPVLPEENNNVETDTRKNIDTYKNENNNLDTYRENLQNTSVIDNIDNVDDNNNNLDNNIIKENGTNTDFVQDEKIDDFNQTVVDNNEIPYNNNVNNGMINNGVNNGNFNNGMYGIGNNGLDDEEGINAPNGVFQNGIITQNNLNNGINNGVNGVQSGNGVGNGLYNERGFNRTTKNIDTYGYNTKIDMLNRGTVNNGINTLSVTEASASQDEIVADEEITESSDQSDENIEDTKPQMVSEDFTTLDDNIEVEFLDNELEGLSDMENSMSEMQEEIIKENIA